MKTAICDDEKSFVLRLEGILGELSADGYDLDISCFTEADSFLKAVSVEHFDIVFLDIEFGAEMNGLDIYASLNRSSPDTKIIYVTSYTEKFIEEIYLNNISVCGIVPKPIDKERIRKMLDKALNETNVNADRSIRITNSRTNLEIPIKSVIYLESHLHHVSIHTDNGIYDRYNKLRDFEYLSEQGFLQCHKSYMVNMSRIASLKKQSFILDNGTTVPISRSYLKTAKESYMRSLTKNMMNDR